MEGWEMQTSYKSQLPEDIFDYIQEHGEVTAFQIASGLNVKYKGRLNSNVVAQTTKRLTGAGRVNAVRDEASGKILAYSVAIQ